MIKFWINSDKIRNRIYLPKYYDPTIADHLRELSPSHFQFSISSLVSDNLLAISTGHEIGKSAYGTGDIPFVRTSDIVNWEIKTAPKQGVSEEIYQLYAAEQDVQEEDILLVRDGTYLIGSNCFVTRIDRKLVYQSHLLKLRVSNREILDPRILFLALNSRIVQRQLRSFQFSSDIIDTIGLRFSDAILIIPKNDRVRRTLVSRVDAALRTRMTGKAFVKHSPFMMEEVLRTGSVAVLKDFASASPSDLDNVLKNETLSAEFGGFQHFWMFNDQIRDLILIPKYYDPSISKELAQLRTHCELRTLGELRDLGILSFRYGIQPGRMFYGSGTIPFYRTTDFANWEIRHDPKHGVSIDVFEELEHRTDVRENDVLLVRDGTYLIGTSCIVTKDDARALFSNGLLKLRTEKPVRLDPFLLLGLLNSWIVKRQIRIKQFTRDVIDTLGPRIDEVVLPIPKLLAVRNAISNAVRQVVESRIKARHEISALAVEIEGH